MNEYPVPAKRDSRICFAIDYFATKEDAEKADVIVRSRGERYNGGFYDGMPCGRDTGFDHKDAEGNWFYAVTRS
jgi:hypothetical protein